jgi:uroporphyrinogen III methyltransferase/synthase
VGTLSTLAELVERERIRAPAIAVIGPVAALRERLQWFERRPLAGVTVAITRARQQASAMGAQLRALGAAVVEAPAIRIVHADGPAPDLGSYDLVCVTSPNGVEALFARLDRAGLDARAFGAARVAAIGPGTSRALARHGIRADVVPERFVAEGLVAALAGVPISRALIARAARARDVLPDALRARGAEVDVLQVYETVIEPLAAERLAAVANADYLTFTASSTVTNLLAALEDRDGVPEHPGARLPVGEDGRRPRIVSIGPVTSGTLREHGLEPDVEACTHDIDGLIEALVADAGRRSRR